MSKFSSWYKNKSGLRNFVEEWKRPFVAGQGGALAGAAIGAAMGNPVAGFMIGGAAGAGAGYAKTQRRKAEERAKKDLERQNNDKNAAAGRLDDIIAPYLPGQPTDGTRSPGDPADSVYSPVTPTNPDMQPVDGGLNLPVVNPGMGNLNTGGAAGQDVASILDEAERAKQLQLDLLNSQQGMRDKTRAELAQILNDQMDRQFNDQMPSYLEDLNTRGLLRSSALGDRLATERAKMAASVNEQLALQGITDQYGGIDALTGVNDQYLKSRQAGLSRRFSLEDWARQMQASKELGQAVTPVTPYSGNSKGGVQDLQTGMSIASLGKSGMGR